jgi:uncharacterized membrane protein
MPTQSASGVRRNSFRRALASFRERVETELWPVPTAAILLGVILGIVLPIVDLKIDNALPDPVGAFLFGGGVDSARAVLSAISGSLITATSLTFSLTVVALQLASSQASPRVLRTFARDRTVHATLAVFVGTFAYSITLLRTVQDGTDTTDPQVPRIALTLASVLTLVSVVMLTLFLGHLARQLRVETTMREVHAETSRTIKLVAHTTNTEGTATPDASRPATSVLALSNKSGFISGVDRARLLAVAVREDLVIEEEEAVGSNIISHTPLAQWWPRDVLVHRDSEQVESISRDIAAAFDLAYERTSSQDIGFGVRQLADIAVRALSPGVNDPTTAVHAIGHLSAIVGDLAELDPQAPTLCDDDGRTRVIVRTHDFADLLETAIQQVRRYGCSDPDVVERLYQLLREVAFRTLRADRREAVAEQLRRVDASVRANDYDPPEREQFAALSQACIRALEGHWNAPPD